MKLWQLLALALTVQEGVTTLALLYKAFQLHYSLWIISLVWFVVTVLQIWLGYLLGVYVKKKSSGSKFDHWVERQSKRLEASIHTSGEKLALAIFSNTISPALGAFFAAWLDLSFWNVMFYSFLGDLVWYLSTLATVFGLTKFFGTSNIKEAAIIIIIIFVVLVLITLFAKKRVV
jgi:membrane protein YqaA with SNARE-associated domain